MQATAKRDRNAPKVRASTPRTRTTSPFLPVLKPSVTGKPQAIPLTCTNPHIRELESTMTAKQITLARCLANPLNLLSQVEMYRQVYDVSPDAQASGVVVNSTTACGNANVSLLTQALRDETDRVNSAVWSNREQMRERLANNLLRYAELAEANGDLKTAVAATKAAGETIMVRLFAKAEPDEATQAAGDLAGELLSKLRSLVSERPATVDLLPSIEAGDSE